MARPVPALLLLAVAGPAAAQSPEVRGGPVREPVVARLGSDRFRQGGRVDAITYSPDGKRLATADSEGVHFWDPAAGRRVRTVRLDSHEVLALRFAADGKTLFAATVAGGFTRLCRLDPAAGKLLDSRPQFIGKGTGRFSPDGKWLALRDESSDELRVIDSATGEAAISDRPAGEKFAGYAWGPDGTLAASTRAPRMRVYDPTTGKVRHDWRFEGDAAWYLAVGPDGKSLVGHVFSAHGNRLVRFDAATGKEHWRRDVRQVGEILVTPDGSAVLYYGTTGADAGPSRWHRLDAATGQPVGPPLDTEYGHEVALRPDGKVLAIGTPAGLGTQWDLTARRRLDAASADPPALVSDLRFSPDGKTVRGWARGWYEWEVRTGKQTRLTPPLDVGASEPVAVSDDQRWLGRFVPDRGFVVSDLRAGDAGRTLTGIDRADQLRFLPAGGLFVRRAESLAVYDPATGTARWTNEVGRDRAVVAAADGSAAVAVLQTPEGARVTRWDLAAGKKDGDWSGAVTRDGMFDVGRSWRPALSPDGRLLALQFVHRDANGARSDRVGVFDARTGRRLCEWDDQRSITAVFSPDRRTVACLTGGAGGFDLREVATGHRRAEVPGLRRAFACVFAPDGRTVAVSIAPGPVEVWDVNHVTGAGPTGADESWAALGEKDAPGSAFEVIGRLRAKPAEAVAFLKDRMKVPRGPPAEWVADRLKGLDAPLYRDREKVSADLVRAGDAVAGQLWDALPTASAEARERLTAILARAQAMTPDKLRAVRACEVLEGVGTPEARALLAEWAKGAPGATLTREAAESLGRLKGR